MRKMDLKDFSKEFPKFAALSLENKKKALSRGVVAGIPDLVAASPVDTGLYAASWDFKVDDGSVKIGNYAPYAGIIEYGTRPFTPPLGPLLAWAKRVLKDSSQPPEYSDDVWKLAVGTQKKISQHGMPPRHIMEKTMPLVYEHIREELRKL